MIQRFIALFLTLLFASPVQAQIIGALPYTLTNGQVADANQVMADFNAIVSSTNANAANAGVNTNITALNGLSTPINPSQGGSSLYLGGTASNTGNAYTIVSPAPTGFTLSVGKSVCFTVSATNTGPVTLNVASTGVTNVFRQTVNLGPVAMVGGELPNGSMNCVFYDGTQFQCTTCGHALVGTVVSFNGVVVPNGWALANGQALSRTTYPTAFSTLAYTSVSATTALTTTVTITGANTFIQVGWFVGGPNVTCNSTVVSVAANSIVISSAAGTAGATTLTIGPYPQGDCSTTFNLPDLIGRLTAGGDGATRITPTFCANSGSIGAACGAQSITLVQANLPTNNYTPAGTVTLVPNTILNTGGSSTAGGTAGPSATTTQTATFAGTSTNIGGSATAFNRLNPLMLVYKIIKL